MWKLTRSTLWNRTGGSHALGGQLDLFAAWLGIFILSFNSRADLQPDMDRPFWSHGATIVGTGYDGDGWPSIVDEILSVGGSFNPDPDCTQWVWENNIEGVECPRLPLHFITIVVTDGAVVSGDIGLAGEQPYLIIEPGARVSGAVNFWGGLPRIHNLGTANLAGTVITGDHAELTNALGATVTGDFQIEGLEAKFLNYGECVVGGPNSWISIGGQDALLLNAGQIRGAGRLALGRLRPRLINSGDIALTADDEGWAGCWLTDANARVLNTGTIVATGSGQNSWELRTFGVGMYCDDATVTNRGYIEATGPLAQAVGIEGDHVLMVNTPSGQMNAEGEEAGAMSAMGHHAVIMNEGEVAVRGAEAEALSVQGTNAWLESQGQITAEGELAAAMMVQGANALLSNKGIVFVEGEGAAGLAVEGDQAAIENSGTVTVSGFPSVGIWTGGEDAAIDNRGELMGMDSGSIGVVVQSPSGPPDGSTGGVVRNFGQITSSGSYSIGVLAIGAGHQVFNTSGLIETQGSQSPAIALGQASYPFPLLQGACYSSSAVNLDQIITHGSNSAGIFGYGNNLKVTNSHQIKTLGLGASGVELRGATNFFEAYGGRIETAGPEAAGIRLDGVSGMVNLESIPQVGLQAVVTTSGDSSPAILLEGSGHIIENKAQLLTQGSNSPGITTIGPGITVWNWRHSSIYTQGPQSPGMRGESQDPGQDGLSWFNGTEIVTEGESSHGMEAYGYGADLSSGLIRTAGSSACGILWSGDEADILIGGPDLIETTGTNAHGIRLAGLGNKVDCSGSIRTYGPEAHAIYVNGRTNLVTISSDGQAIVQSADSAAIVLAGFHNAVANLGTVGAPYLAILGSDGEDLVINGGEIIGRVDLGPGNDEFIARDTGVDGATTSVSGGDGNDVFTVFAENGDYLDGDRVLAFEEFHKLGPGWVELTGTLRSGTVRVEQGTLSVVRSRIECTSLSVIDGTLELDDGRVECEQEFINRDRVCGNGVIRVGGISTETIKIEGKLCPGFSIGKLTFTGDTIFSGSMDIEIAGPDNYDIIEFDGPVTFLGGQINLYFLNDFVPEEGQKVAFMTATAMEGVSSAEVTATGLPDDFSASLNPADGSIEVRKTSSVPRFLGPVVVDGGQVIISWEPGSGVILQQSVSLSAPAWTDVPESEGQSGLEIPASEASRFYRLIRR